MMRHLHADAVSMMNYRVAAVFPLSRSVPLPPAPCRAISFVLRALIDLPSFYPADPLLKMKSESRNRFVQSPIGAIMIHQRVTFPFAACRNHFCDEQGILSNDKGIDHVTIEICHAALK